MDQCPRPHPATAVVLAAAALLSGCSADPSTPATATAAPTASPSGTPTVEVSDPAADPSPAPIQEGSTVQIRLTTSDVVLTATLADNPTAEAFAAQLPMTVPISDHADTEKVFHPPSGLTTQGASDGYDPSAGDIAYYAPWGNVAVYYRDFSWSAGLVPVGRLDGDPTVLAALPDDTQMRIDLL